MTRHLAPHGLSAALIALLVPFSSAQQTGFEPQVRTVGLPFDGSKLQTADVTADGILDAVLMHGQELSLLHGPSLYAEVDGDAVATPLVDGAAAVRDFALFPEVGSEQAAGVLALLSTGLELLTWDEDSGDVQATPVLGFADPRHVDSWTVEGADFTVVAVVEGDGSSRTAVFLNSTGALFSVTEVVPLGKADPIRAIELLNWDGEGLPEIAVVRDDILEIYQLDGLRVADFPVMDGARVTVLHYGPSTPDRLARVDREAQTGTWFLDVLDAGGVEPTSVPLPDEPLALSGGDHEQNDLPDVLIAFQSGQVLLYAHEAAGGSASFHPGEAYAAFPGLTSPPTPPVLAVALADLDGDGDGDALAVDSAATGWLAYGAPEDASRWWPSIEDGDLDPALSQTEEVRLTFEVRLPDDVPDGPATHAQVVIWAGSSATGMEQGTRQSSLAVLPLTGTQVDVGILVSNPKLGSELHYVAEIRLVEDGPPLHAYPALFGDVTVTFEEEVAPPEPDEDSRGLMPPTPSGGGGILRGTFVPIPPGPPPPFTDI